MSPSISSDGLENFSIYPTWVKENCKKFSDKNTVCNMTKIHFEKYEKYEKFEKSKILRFSLQRTIVIRKWLEFWLELLTIDYDLPVTLFKFFVFFKVYFDHVPDCISVWNFFTIFFDSCRINRKIFEPNGRYWRRQTICALDVKLVRPTLHKTQFFWGTL